MASAGPNSGGTFATATLAGSDGGGFANLSNLGASDNAYAIRSFSFSGGGTAHSDWVKATNFGFAIPSGATIDGIVVEIERKASTAAFNGKDKSVMLVKGGTISSTDKKNASNWPTSDAYQTYGGATDLWGLTLTDTDVNASNFGVAIAVQTDGTGKSGWLASIDHIRITVYYTDGGGGGGKPAQYYQMMRNG